VYGHNNIDIMFNLAKDGHISIDVYDFLGNNVATIANGFYFSGSHTHNFNLLDNNGNRLVSGAYQIRFNSGMDVKQFKLIIAQ